MSILPLLFVPALAAVIVYWLTGRRGAALVAGAVVLGVMLYIGIMN